MSIQTQPEGPPFEAVIIRRRLRWDWSLRNRAGKTVMRGREKSRAEARYQSERALFLMLLASCRRGLSRAAG